MYQNATTREIATTIHKWINDRRARRDLEPLSGRATLNRAAERHSRRMADTGSYTHHLGDGAGSRASEFREVGENIHKIVPVDDPQRVAARAVGAWMTSDGHRRNALNASARLDGVGVHIRGDTAFITHLFASGSGVS